VQHLGILPLKRMQYAKMPTKNMIHVQVNAAHWRRWWLRRDSLI